MYSNKAVKQYWPQIRPESKSYLHNILKDDNLVYECSIRVFQLTLTVLLEYIDLVHSTQSFKCMIFYNCLHVYYNST